MTHLTRGLVCGLGALFASAALADSTAATLHGQIRTTTDEPISEARVEIRHAPSGTAREAVTGDNGSFYQSGLRVGGPYEIRVTRGGYRDHVLRQLSLRPGTQAPLLITLVGRAIEEVVITASAPTSTQDLNNGVGSVYSAADIANQPSVTRDVIRTLLRDPLAQSAGQGNLSVGGVNPRFNGLAIDGALQQDDFGLGTSTYATSRSPINLDAIESASLVASDYSVSASGFTGGLVNITTKSGTNEWDGAAFYYFHDDDQVGETYDGSRAFAPPPFEEEEYGVSLGGPLVSDRLFVFLSYDEFKSVTPVDFAAFDASRGIQPGFFEAFRGVVRDALGYDPGGRPASATTPEDSERTLVKLDWNAGDAHRASFTYQRSQETGSSVSADRMASAWIDVPVELTAYTLRLFSDWSSRASTTLRVNFKEFARSQNCRAQGVGALEFDNLDAANLAGTPLEGLITGSVDLVAGCDRFRHANLYDDERLQLYAALDYVLGDHILRVGAEYETFDLFNLFMPSSNGRYVFANFDAILSGTARIDYVNVPSNQVAEGAAAWSYGKTTLFVQDTWRVGSDLELTAGLRYEYFNQDDAPAFSQTIADTYGIRTDRGLDGLDLLMPRLSFRWTGLPGTVVTGGLGRFSGGDPKVWTSNVFQAPTVFARVTATGVSPTSIPAELHAAVAAGNPLAIDAIAPGFEVPSDWKASLRIEHDLDLSGLGLGSGYTLAAQGLVSWTGNGFLWTNLAQTHLTETEPTGTAPDGRRIYADLDDLGILNLVALGNHDEGLSKIITASVGKRYDSGFDFQVSYAWQDIEAVTEGISSRGISNWRGIADTDRNNPSARISPYEVTHSVKLNLGYERSLGKGFQVGVNLFGRAWTGDRFTYTFDVDRGNALFGRAGAGESPYDNNPLYVPARGDDPSVVYGAGFDREAFFAYLDANGIASGVHAPYSANAGMNQVWDLQVRLELPGISAFNRWVGENRVSLVLDIENVLNLLNDEWGVYDQGPSFGQAAIVRADLVSASDVAVFGVEGAPALAGDASRTACLRGSDCVYRFNSFRSIDRSFPSAPRSVYRIRFGVRIDL